MIENSSIRFRIQVAEVARILDIVGSARLTIVRVVNEQAQLIELAYAHPLLQDPASTVRGLLIGLPSSAILLPLDASGWHRVTFDPALDEQTTGELVAAATEGTPTGGTIAYIDAGMPGMTEMLRQLTQFRPTSVAPDGNVPPSFIAAILN